MNKIYVTLGVTIFIIMLIYTTAAQTNEFRVLAAKGEVLIQKNGKGNWEKIYTGGQINANDKIKLIPGSYLGLVHAKGKTIELKKDGTYSATKLSKEVAGMKSTMTGQLANLIVSEVGSTSGLLSNKDNNKSMNQSGVVERNLDSEFIKSNSLQVSGDRILIQSPIKEHLLGNDVMFEWNKVPSENEYDFYLTDRYDRLEFSKTTSDSFLVVDTKQLNLEKGVYYFWRVIVKEKPEMKSDEACFMILTDSEITGINDTLKLLKEELGNEQTAISKLMYAVFFEKYNLIGEAKASYLDALKIAPDVEVYNNLYHNFLRRHYQSGY
ncbi:MAG: hypothetical protein A2X61_02165 [Ignavibacteria bacterium GWB2_35_12]|nr:MAG: hypothetical protein A2X63_09120 [Ignavibacteria bacterium GWA2_35_8]OGU38690.1 MAG: hypothetical protein A2X61_02165 [Ignavibacteria bacterium GWB2_35_12]OGU88821.1 MAG: hypothetical protein A2220_16780 [Ignavibacteria bacterium RIFOXYA2_FULL_35_10]OGV20892.1 MAG: hypothetical protein A2475_02020 [Ignavibacteria bacterium RIFOXYC2_FULL_35_21]